MKIFPAAFVMTAVFASTLSAYAEDWQDGSGASCSLACKDHGGAFSSGLYKGAVANPFYVCRSNANNEGSRAGYNLNAAYGEKKCVVPYGGKEVPQGSYECLCSDDPR
jgi:hypothetical protein